MCFLAINDPKGRGYQEGNLYRSTHRGHPGGIVYKAKGMSYLNKVLSYGLGQVIQINLAEAKSRSSDYPQS